MDKVHLIIVQSKTDPMVKEVVIVYEDFEEALIKVQQLNSTSFGDADMHFYVDTQPVWKKPS